LLKTIQGLSKNSLAINHSPYPTNLTFSYLHFSFSGKTPATQFQVSAKKKKKSDNKNLKRNFCRNISGRKNLDFFLFFGKNFRPSTSG
jgi:hypothetical protein